MTQLQGFFEKNFTLSPDYCGASARMSPLAAFTMFQAIAARACRSVWFDCECFRPLPQNTPSASA